MRFKGTIHSAEVVLENTLLGDYKAVLDLHICTGYALAGENDEHICAVFPDSITTEISFAMFLCDLEVLRVAGFRGEVILERDVLQLTKYNLTDDGVVTLDGKILYGDAPASATIRTNPDNQPIASLNMYVGVTDLNEQYAWLMGLATAFRRTEGTVIPEPLIGLLNYFEGMREIIREASPDLCPLLDIEKEPIEEEDGG